MWIHEGDSEKCVHWNWIAIFSYAASLAVSLAIWSRSIPGRRTPGEVGS